MTARTKQTHIRETKSVSLADFKAITDGPGGFSGYITKWGELDDVGDIVLKGAYLKTIPQFLKNGFVSDNHDWTYSKSPGYPIALKEDDIGAWTEMRYFSTPDAQDNRTKTQERLAAGMTAALSIGYEPEVPPMYVRKADYAAELPKYVRPELLQDALQKAQRFAQVRILPELHLYEYGTVGVPALRSAGISAVKSTDDKDASTTNIKGMFEDALADRTNSLWNLWDVFICVYYAIQQQDDAAETLMLPFDFPAAVNEIVGEFAARLSASIIEEDAEEDSAGGDTDDGLMNIGYSGQTPDRVRKAGLVYDSSFSANLQTVVNAAERVTGWAEKRANMRTKEGRTFSAANVAELDDLRSQLADLTDRLAKLLEIAKPKEKDEEKGLDPEFDKLFISILQRNARLRGVPLT